MPTSTAQNLVSHFRSAARLTCRRSATSNTTSSKKHSSAPPSSASAAQKKASFSSTLSSEDDAAKKYVSSSAQKKPSSSSSSSSRFPAVAEKKVSSSSTSSSSDDALKEYLSSISSSSSSADGSHALSLLKKFKAPPSWTFAAPPKSSLGDVISGSLNSGSGNDDEESAEQLKTYATGILYDEMDLEWDDESEDGLHRQNLLGLLWSSAFSKNIVSSKEQGLSQGRKQGWVYEDSENSRIDRLVNTCAKRMGPDTTISVFGKLGKDTGLKEFNSLIKICIQKGRDTMGEDVSVEKVCKVYNILAVMRERGFKIEEETYGQCLMYVIDCGMVDKFFSFCELIKKENPASLQRLAYYEMLLWITVNNELKVQELTHSAMAVAAEEKSQFREHVLLALGEGHRKEEFLMLLKTFDITMLRSLALLECVFKSLGKFYLESYAEDLLLLLKRSDIGAENISNLICEYAVGIPNLAVEHVIEKFHTWHNRLEVLPTSPQYEKLIKYCCEFLKVHEALNVVDKALESGAALSLETFHLILDACGQSFEFNLVHHINLRISSSHCLKPNLETFRRMILLYVKMKDYEGAYRLINDLQKMDLKPTAGMYNIILAGYLHEKNIKCAMNVLRQMEDTNVEPDALTYSHLIGNCQHEKDIIKHHDDMINLRIKPTKQVFMAMINAYASCGLFEKAEQVILDERIPKKDLNKIKSVLVSALASNGQFSAALEMYEAIKEAKCSLEPKAIRCLIEHFQSEGELSKLFQLLGEIKGSPHWIDACFWVISQCVQEENLSATVDLLKQLKDKFSDVVPLEVLFEEVFCLYAEKEATSMQFGLDLLQAIKEEFGICPSRKSLDFLLSVCVRTKDSKASFVIWKEYKTAGLPYNVLSYLRMYQSLLASGDRKSAAQILNKMPKDDSHVRCVIKACQETYTKPAPIKKEKKEKEKALTATLGLLDALKAAAK